MKKPLNQTMKKPKEISMILALSFFVAMMIGFLLIVVGDMASPKNDTLVIIGLCLAALALLSIFIVCMVDMLRRILGRDTPALHRAVEIICLGIVMASAVCFFIFASQNIELAKQERAFWSKYETSDNASFSKEDYQTVSEITLEQYAAERRASVALLASLGGIAGHAFIRNNEKKKKDTEPEKEGELPMTREEDL